MSEEEKVTREEVMEKYRTLVESGDPMDTIALMMAQDPDLSAAALLYRSLRELEEPNARAEEDPTAHPHLAIGMEKRRAEIEMMRGLYESMLDRAVEETVAIVNECHCPNCQAQNAHLN